MLLTTVGLWLLQAVPLFCKTYEIADGVYSFEQDSNDLYTSMFVVTGSGVIIFDPMNTLHSKAMLEEIKEITTEPVKWVFYSHNHWDHIAGAQVFKDEGPVKIIAHKEAYKWLKEFPGPDILLPDQVWWGNEKTVNLGSKTLKLHYFGPSHGLGMTTFVLVVERVAYIADTVTPNRVGFSFLPDFDIKGWENTLEKNNKLNFDKAIYSHNNNPEPIKGGDKEDIVELRQYLQDIEDGIASEVKKGTNFFAIPRVLKLPKYEKWAFYDEWLGLNIQSIQVQDLLGPYNRAQQKSNQVAIEYLA